MLVSIRNALNDGVRCYAECGGLMYLTDNIDGSSVTGFLNGNACMSGRLQNFGYATLEVTAANALLPQGLKMNCHEFHNSYVNIDERNIYKVKKSTYDGSVKQWSGGYVKKNTLATYQHVHFFGNMQFVEALLDGN
jgi:cobyrinic acid a,c-diamide synthase